MRYSGRHRVEVEADTASPIRGTSSQTLSVGGAFVDFRLTNFYQRMFIVWEKKLSRGVYAETREYK